ncbi:MAG: SpoIIE family protein phosphatase [Vicingaceae bacterium]
MSSLLKKIFQNHSTRVLVLLFLSLFILIAYFLTHSYYVQLEIHKNRILSKLEAVASTAATQLDGNQLEYLFDSYKEKDEIETNYQDRVYQLLHEKLLVTKKQNSLSSAIYTLTYDSTKGCFLFGVSSSPKPFFRHKYDHFPPSLLEKYNKGGRIDVYEDQNGHWLSAFACIRNSKGEVVGIVQADQRFDEFLYEAQREIFINIGLSLGFAAVLLFFLIRAMRSILSKEDELTASLMQSKLELEQKNQDTLDSIIYAKKIQEAILPMHSRLQQWLPNSFIFHLPRDIVSGDFYWFKKVNGKVFIACVDCTGHGVPGAFMSMIGTILLDDIIGKKQFLEADEILNQLHLSVVKALKQNRRSKASQDGMDIALCIIDEPNNSMQFAGAFRPLVHIRKGELYRIKSDAAPIGGFRGEEPSFSKHEINLEKGDTFYIYTDGYADQFGGANNKKYMTKKFRELLLRISTKSIADQEKTLQKEFDHWKGDSEQVDDVLVIGFQI